ncbi:MAG: long-chain-fatty-acid--CoA ligase [Sphingomonas adhaesiva]|uniref:long-chain-fatty-acid--CoA ligase n=1 Tax=Sphingomonas adhaesiva TaxID=28212 RepID=UPI002FF4BF8B
MALRFAERTVEAYRFPLLVRHLLHSALATGSRAELVGSDGSRRDYPAFADRVGRLAQMLCDLGVGEGDVVAVMDWDSHRYLETYFAVPMMGAVLQTVNVRLSPAQIAFTLNQTGARTLLLHADFETLYASFAGDVPCIGRIVAMHDGVQGDLSAPFMAGEYEALLAATGHGFAFRDFDEDALATTFHTTGTTGDPKAVTFSHRQLVLHTLTAMAALGTRPDAQSFRDTDVYMPITPMFHVHAWGLPYVATLMGVKQVYPGRYIADRLVETKEREGVTFSHGVPTIIQMMVDAIGTRRLSGPWKMVVGGSLLPLALHEAAARAGISTFAGYGMSETGPILTLARDDGSAPDVCCHAGRPVPLVQLRLDEGEVTVRSPWLTHGYVGNADASADLWRDGWLHTQDVGTIEPNGDLVIRDRIKDVIKSGGEWVSSAEMEDLTLRHPAVAAACYVGVADPFWGERPVAFVVPRGPMPTLAEIHDHLSAFVHSGRISRYALPDRLIAIDTLPRTSVGKIDKKALRATLAGSTAGVAA